MSNKEKNIVIFILGIIIIILMTLVVGTKIEAEKKKNMDHNLIHIDTSGQQRINSRFERYVGNNSGSNVKSLLGTIITNNSTEYKYKEIYISLNGKTPVSMPSDIGDLMKEIDRTKTYFVNITYDEVGNVDQVIVDEQQNSP